MRKCPICGMENEDGVAFCAACGGAFTIYDGTVQNVGQMGIQYGASVQNEMPMQQGVPYGVPTQNRMPMQQGAPYGAPAQNVMPMQGETPVKPPKRPKTKKEKTKIKIIAIMVVVLVLLLAGGGIFLFLQIDDRKITINLNDYVDIKYDGYDGYGTAVATFDSEKFKADYEDKIRYTRKIGDVYNQQYGYKLKNKDIKNMYKPYDLFSELVLPEVNSSEYSNDSYEGYTDEYSFDSFPESTDLGTLSKKTRLSNGDTVDFNWIFDVSENILKGFNVKLEYSDLQVKVSGLEQLATMDMFSGVKVTFDGYAPNGTATLEANTDDWCLNYTLDKTEGLKNGDTVVVTVSYDKAGEDLAMYCVNNYQMLPESDTKEFVVEGLPSYAMKLDEISDDLKARMDEKARRDIEKNKYDEVELRNVEFLGYYMLTDKDMDVGIFDYMTKIYLVYKIDAVCDEYEEQETMYCCIGFEDVTILADGTETTDLDHSDNPSNNTYFYGIYGFETLDAAFKSCVTDNIEDYDYESTVAQ